MSQAFVVDVEAPIRETIVDDPVTLGVNVDFDGNVTVDNTFVQVAVDTSKVITWNLTSDLPNVVFDNPAITMFGEYPEWEVLAAEGALHQVRWFNTDPDKKGRSFYYRIHVVEQTGPATFIPHSSDPIVRNDPPPAM